MAIFNTGNLFGNSNGQGFTPNKPQVSSPPPATSVWGGIKSTLGNLFGIQSAPVPAAQASPEAQAAWTAGTSHGSPTHSVSTKTAPDGSSTVTTTPVATQPQILASSQTNPNIPTPETGSLYAGTGSFAPGAQTQNNYASPFYTDTSTYNNTYPSTTLSGNTSYDSIMRQRAAIQAQQEAAYGTYNTQKAQYDNMLNLDKANSIQAGMSGNTVDAGIGAQGMLDRSNALKELAASSALNVAQVPLNMAQNQLTNVNTNLSNYYNQQQLGLQQAPQYQNQTVNPTTGDIYATIRDPKTGAVSLQVVGNAYSGQYNGTNGGSSQSNLQSGGQGGYPSISTPEGKAYYASPEFASQLPPTVYPAKRTTSDGSTYFDAGALGDNASLAQARLISTATGIPIISGEDAKAVNTVDQAKKNLQLLQSNFESLASAGVGGALASNITDPFNQLFQTTRGSAIDTYNSNRNGILQQIRALAGSSPRINGTELQLANNALPTLDEFNKDTLQTGRNKIATTMGYLNNALTTLIPGYGGQSGQASGNTLGNSTVSGGGLIKAKDGTVINPNF